MKDIPGYEGHYAIAEDGQVWSYKSNKFLKHGYCGDYPSVVLSKNNVQRRRTIHRLMMETFNPVEGMEKLEVNHIDENKTNNVLSNLEWVTRKENINHGTHNERAAETKRKQNRSHNWTAKAVICIETGAVYRNQTEAAEATGLRQCAISRCCLGQQKTTGGLHWEFVPNLDDGFLTNA